MPPWSVWTGDRIRCPRISWWPTAAGVRIAELNEINIFLDSMARHHCQHLALDIDQYTKTVMEEVVDKDDLKQESVDI